MKKYQIYNVDELWVGQTDNLAWAMDFIKKHGGFIYTASGLLATYLPKNH